MLHCRLRNAGQCSSAQRRADAITEIPQKASLIYHSRNTDRRHTRRAIRLRRFALQARDSNGVSC